MANSVNREDGHYRRPVGDSRTVVSSEATCRWTREASAGHACVDSTSTAHARRQIPPSLELFGDSPLRSNTNR